MIANPRSRGWTLAVLALGLAAGLLAVLNWELSGASLATSPLAAPPLPTGATPPARAEGPRPARPLSALTETLARPLFSPTRRPPAAEAAQPSPPPLPPASAATIAPGLDGVRIVGISGTGTRGRRALARPDDAQAGTWLAEGDELRGWKIIAITDTAVVLAFGNERRELSLFPARIPASEAPPKDGTAKPPPR